MNFDYSEDQRFLKEEARKFLAASSSLAVVRGVLDDSGRSFDPALWKAVAEMGWLSLAVPEEHGGLGLGPVELCAIAEELGRALAPIPFSSTVYLFLQAILAAGTDAQKARYLPGIAAGELIGCLAASEGPGPLDPNDLDAVVVGGRLTGTKVPVTDGDVASHAIVVAREGERIGLFVADLGGDGVVRETLRTLDPTRGAAQLTFRDCPVEPLGHGDGTGLLEALLDRAAVYLAFEQIGGADRVLEMARDYALERYAFGRAIGSYQAIKHKLADMYVRNQIARSNAYYGAWALSAADAPLARAAAAARVAACDAYWFASKEAIEVFGGIGTTWEADNHLFYRRAKQLALVIGGPVVWQERLVAALERSNGSEG